MSPNRKPESRFLAPCARAGSTRAGCARAGSTRAGRRGPRSLQGFTLVELMVTVVIIAIIAALATPGIMARVNGYKARSAAELVASTYRLARLRAMGRGSAVVVRFNSGDITVLEGIQGSANSSHPGCENLPSPSCTTPDTRFNSGQETITHQIVEAYDAEGASYTLTSSLGATTDICFTPLGRAYSRNSATGIFSPLLTPATVAVSPGSGGLTRRVVVLPSGTARVIAGAL